MMSEETAPPAAQDANHADAAVPAEAPAPAPAVAAGGDVPHDAAIADPVVPAPADSPRPEDAAPTPQADAPADAPADVPADALADAPADVPADVPAEAPADGPADVPADAPVDALVDAPEDAEADAPADTPADVPTDAAPTPQADAPADVPADAPADALADVSAPISALYGVVTEPEAVVPPPAPEEAATAMEVESVEAAEALAPDATPQDLYDRIEKSRDRLFFVAYEKAAPKRATPRKGRSPAAPAKKEPSHAWHLARVDLSTSADDCRDAGQYYVEFYAKASYDCGVLLLGHPPEDGVPKSEMQPRPDSASRFWLEWHEFHNKKNGDMVVGKAKELLPNSRKALARRLRDLAEPGGEEDGRSDSERRLVSEYDPDFDRHTPMADFMDLTDPRVRLVGPFDFADAKPPPPTKEDLRACEDDATRALYRKHHKDLWVRDRVPLGEWEALERALEGRDVAPPTFEAKKKGDKRGRTSVGPATPAKKRALGKGGKPFLRLPRKGGRPAVVVRELGGAGEPAVLSKKQLQDEVRAVVEGALKGTRHAQGADRKIYYAVDEFKGALEEALGAWAQGHGAKEEEEAAPVKHVLLAPGAGAEAPQEDEAADTEMDVEAETPQEEQAAGAEAEAEEESAGAEVEAEVPEEEQGAGAEAPQEEQVADVEAEAEPKVEAEVPQEEQAAGAEVQEEQAAPAAGVEAAGPACDGEVPQVAAAVIVTAQV